MTEAPFGLRVHAALKGLAHGHVILGRIRYDGIQRMKAATRPELHELFRGSPYGVLRRIREGTADELARFLNDLAGDGTARHTLFFEGARLLPPPHHYSH